MITLPDAERIAAAYQQTAQIAFALVEIFRDTNATAEALCAQAEHRSNAAMAIAWLDLCQILHGSH